MQALIVRDTFDNSIIAEDLKSSLIQQGFKVVEIQSLNYINEAKVQLNPNEPCLFYKNIFMRVANPAFIWKFQKQHKLETLRIKSNFQLDVISFLPKNIRLKPKNIARLEVIGIPYDITNFKIQYVCPNEDISGFLYTFNRDTYLKLTVQSLQHSLIKPIPIKILLNGVTQKVRETAFELAANDKNIELLETENTFIGATNILIQWTGAKKFILMEDDFIYPVSVKHHFPNWPYQFADRLNHFDLVGWQVTADNAPHGLGYSRDYGSCLDSDWEILQGTSQLIMAQSMAIRTDYYKQVLKAEIHDSNTLKYYACFDVQLLKHTHKVNMPSMRGYHSGWNQEMDGFAALADGRRHLNLGKTKFQVKSLNTGEQRTIDLQDLAK